MDHFLILPRKRLLSLSSGVATAEPPPPRSPTARPEQQAGAGPADPRRSAPEHRSVPRASSALSASAAVCSADRCLACACRRWVIINCLRGVNSRLRRRAPDRPAGCGPSILPARPAPTSAFPAGAPLEVLTHPAATTRSPQIRTHSHRKERQACRLRDAVRHAAQSLYAPRA